MDRRFIKFENDGKFVRFIWQGAEEPRDGIGSTGLKFKCSNGNSPIELIEFAEEKVIFKIVEDCHLYDGNYQDQQLKKDELYYGYPDGKIEKI